MMYLIEIRVYSIHYEHDGCARVFSYLIFVLGRIIVVICFVTSVMDYQTMCVGPTLYLKRPVLLEPRTQANHFFVHHILVIYILLP